MHKLTNPFGLLSLFVLLVLAACAPAGGLSNEDQVASIVAATLNAQGALPTQAPLDGEIPTQSSFGACANSGQLNLAYVKDSDAWLWVENGPHSQLTGSGDVNDVRISSDGCRIAFSRALPNPLYDPNVEFPLPATLNELWVVASDGTGNQMLAGANFFAGLPAPDQGSTFSLYKFEWQPGTYTLAFNTEVLHEGPGLGLGDDLYLVSADSAVVTPLLGQGQGGNFFFSPNGLSLAFSTPTTANVINVDGSNLRANLITFPFVLTYSEYAYYPPLSWSPDSNALMVAIPPEDGLAAPANGVYPETDLWYIPLDGTPAFQAGAVQNVWFVQSEIHFSPDIGRIAYLRPVGAPELSQYEFVVALSNGSNESIVFEIPSLIFGDWAPDNNRFIYTIHEIELQVWMGNSANENVVPISQLTAFLAARAQMEWVAGETFVLLVQGEAGAELSIMQTSGAGVLVATSANFNLPFDVAN